MTTRSTAAYAKAFPSLTRNHSSRRLSAINDEEPKMYLAVLWLKGLIISFFHPVKSGTFISHADMSKQWQALHLDNEGAREDFRSQSRSRHAHTYSMTALAFFESNRASGPSRNLIQTAVTAIE